MIIMNPFLFYIHYTVLLLFGISLSFSFSKIYFDKKTARIMLTFSIFCAVMQLILYLILQESRIWQIYPLITHIPTILLIRYYYHHKLSTAVSAVTTAYLCCQPADILGTLVYSLSNNSTIEYAIRIISLVLTFLLIRKICKSILAELFTRANRGVYVFGLIPIGFYIYDYVIGLYTDFWFSHNTVAREILPTFLAFMFLWLCIAYHKEYALRETMEQKDQIIAMTVEQQRKELESIYQSTTKLYLLRHDMRHILNGVASCISNQDTEKALDLIAQFTEHVDSTKIIRYCENEILNYVIASYAEKCNSKNIDFICKAEIGKIPYDETMLSSILSNSLENALHAQLELPENERQISLMLKYSNDKLLLSVKNPYFTRPTFRNGMPITQRRGHGYGTQSIRYTTEQLGGNCQFLLQDNLFTLRVVI